VEEKGLLNRLRKLTLNTTIGILHNITVCLMVFLFSYSLLTWLYTSSVWGLGGIFWSSWMTFAFVYLGTAFFLRISGVSAAMSFIISLTSAISVACLYEILYHFSFWDSWNYGKPPYFLLKENTVFLGYGLVSLSALVGRKYMTMSKWLWVPLLPLVGLWIFWITIGFPQHEFPQTLFDFAWPRIRIDNPHALAFPLNSMTKFLLGATYVLLYLPNNRKLSEAKKGFKRFLTERGFLPL
jgi:hypothetical protein